jgi:hypothetical protein
MIVLIESKVEKRKETDRLFRLKISRSLKNGKEAKSRSKGFKTNPGSKAKKWTERI